MLPSLRQRGCPRYRGNIKNLWVPPFIARNVCVPQYKGVSLPKMRRCPAMNAKQRRYKKRHPAVKACRHCYCLTYIRKYCLMCGGKL